MSTILSLLSAAKESRVSKEIVLDEYKKVDKSALAESVEITISIQDFDHRWTDVICECLQTKGNKLQRINFKDQSQSYTPWDSTFLEKIMEGLKHPNNKVCFINIFYRVLPTEGEGERLFSIIEDLARNTNFQGKIIGLMTQLFGRERSEVIKKWFVTKLENMCLMKVPLEKMCWNELMRADNDCTTLPIPIVNNCMNMYAIWPDNKYLNEEEKLDRILEMIERDGKHKVLAKRIKSVIEDLEYR